MRIVVFWLTESQKLCMWAKGELRLDWKRKPVQSFMLPTLTIRKQIENYTMLGLWLWRACRRGSLIVVLYDFGFVLTKKNKQNYMLWFYWFYNSGQYKSKHPTLLHGFIGFISDLTFIRPCSTLSFNHIHNSTNKKVRIQETNWLILPQKRCIN